MQTVLINKKKKKKKKKGQFPIMELKRPIESLSYTLKNITISDKHTFLCLRKIGPSDVDATAKAT
jgi:hypothetical protein